MQLVTLSGFNKLHNEHWHPLIGLCHQADYENDDDGDAYHVDDCHDDDYDDDDDLIDKGYPFTLKIIMMMTMGMDCWF